MFINLTKAEVEETVTALEETKWIPCNERMPKGTVLCCDDRGEMLVGLLCKTKRDMWHMTMMDKKCITVLPGCRYRNCIRRLKMNNQQAIDRLVKHLECGWSEETVEAIEMGIHALKETQWIPCSEKMPEDNTDVIVCFYSGTVTEMRYWGNGIFQGIYEHTAKTIVSWMPLPKPYMEKTV